MKPFKRDANHPAVVAALRKIGCSVLDLSAVGGGCPDILAALAGRSVLFEIKNPKRRGWDAKRNVAQLAFRETWRGECYVVFSPLEAVEKMLGADFRLQQP